MATPDELKLIFQKYVPETLTENQIEAVCQACKGNKQIIVQVAKYINNVEQAENSQFGDRITYEGLDQEIKLIIQELREILQHIKTQTSPQTQDDKYVVKNSSETRFILPAPPPIIKKFEFEVVTVDAYGIETKRCSKPTEYFIESLGDRVILEMVAIPEGKFKMGAEKDEEASQEEERPTHRVYVKPFFLSKYPITQAQWKVIAQLPKINRDINPEISEFKGDNLPVERVSWYDAQEFCQRLSRETGRTYRLPSEAEWEYACRATTSTPFYFNNITTHVANYYRENEDIDGVCYQQTTELGRFPANFFGLHDMHGNVWEWCADYYHDDYYGAPQDGSVWLDDGYEEYRILRGGSCDSPSNMCRSAYRFFENPSVYGKAFGFRVVCS
ncbi:Protein of unknown function DUF323 [Calothrix sp. PCC 7716]|nr:Protein of unknown function DUF323 [Calothrix sp. PCC 7716]